MEDEKASENDSWLARVIVELPMQHNPDGSHGANEYTTRTSLPRMTTSEGAELGPMGVELG